MWQTLKISALILYVLAIFGLFFFIDVNYGDEPLNGVNISLYRDTPKGFVDTSMVKTQLLKVQQLDSLKLNSVKIWEMEHYLRDNQFIKSADIFKGVNGELFVNIKEEKPLLRIFNRKSKSFYVSKEGKILAMSGKYTPRVMIVNGYINIGLNEGHNYVSDTIYRKTPLQDLYKLSGLISNDEFLNAQLNQIYINSKNEIELIPELGNQTIVLGNLDNIEIKLRNLNAFYKQALLDEGINKYRKIDLRFDGQIVCTRR